MATCSKTVKRVLIATFAIPAFAVTLVSASPRSASVGDVAACRPPTTHVTAAVCVLDVGAPILHVKEAENRSASSAAEAREGILKETSFNMNLLQGSRPSVTITIVPDKRMDKTNTGEGLPLQGVRVR